MGSSYDDKIETILVTRQRVAEQRKIKRQEELRKQIGVLGGAVVALILVIAIIFKACNGDTSKEKEQATTQVEVVTTGAETTVEETTPEETTVEETTAVVEAGVMYTTDLLNFRTEPSTEGALIKHLEKGTQVKVINTQDGWSQIEYEEHTGYVSAEYLSTEKPQ